MYLIGIDIGGTNIKIGLIENNQIVDKLVKPTNTFDIIKQIHTIVYELLANNDLNIKNISGIGVGIPGIVIDGIVKESVSIQLRDCDLANILYDEFKVPVRVLNDADMATLAENRFGAGKNVENMVMLTIGTGVGGGAIANGKLIVGNGGAGEFGHIIYVKNGIECNCGRKGCYEKYVSASALTRRTKDLMMTMDSQIQCRDNDIYATDIMSAYNAGDICAKQVIEEYLDNLSNFVTSICDIFRPQIIVIGGGLSYAKDLIKLLDVECKNKFYGYKNSPKVEILPANLGNDAGILGTICCF